MAKSTKNRGKAWTVAEVKKLRELAKKKTPTADIGLKLQRTKSGVRHKANELGVSLKPANQSRLNLSKKK